MIETGFAEQFLASYGMGPAPIYLKKFREHSLKQDLSNDTSVNPSLFSLVNTFKDLCDLMDDNGVHSYIAHSFVRQIPPFPLHKGKATIHAKHTMYRPLATVA